MMKNTYLTYALEANSLDTHNSKALVNHLKNDIEVKGFPHVILDFSKINFIDSSGFGALISLSKVLRMHQKELILIDLKKPIQEVFRLMSMHKIFTTAKDIEEAEKILYPLD